MQSQPYIIPEITLDHHLSDELLAVSDTIITDLLFSVRLHNKDIVESTHLTRKRLKLLRAFLKLLQKCVDTDSIKTLNVTYRDWGQKLSELRDVHVHSMILNDNSAEYSKKLGPGLFQNVKGMADYQVEQLENQLVIKHEIFDDLEHQIYNHSSLTSFIHSNKFEPDCILEGFRTSYRKSYQAFIQAEASSLPEPFHEWRKRLKDVQYQSALLRSEQNILNDSDPNIEAICELLGKDQDLNNFIFWLDRLNLEPIAVKNLIKDLKKSQLELKRTLIIDGNSFYKHSSV